VFFVWIRTLFTGAKLDKPAVPPTAPHAPESAAAPA